MKCFLLTLKKSSLYLNNNYKKWGSIIWQLSTCYFSYFLPSFRNTNELFPSFSLFTIILCELHNQRRPTEMSKRAYILPVSYASLIRRRKLMKWPIAEKAKLEFISLLKRLDSHKKRLICTFVQVHWLGG